MDSSCRDHPVRGRHFGVRGAEHANRHHRLLRLQRELAARAAGDRDLSARHGDGRQSLGAAAPRVRRVAAHGRPPGLAHPGSAAAAALLLGLQPVRQRAARSALLLCRGFLCAGGLCGSGRWRGFLLRVSCQAKRSQPLGLGANGGGLSLVFGHRLLAVFRFLQLAELQLRLILLGTVRQCLLLCASRSSPASLGRGRGTPCPHRRDAAAPSGNGELRCVCPTLHGSERIGSPGRGGLRPLRQLAHRLSLPCLAASLWL